MTGDRATGRRPLAAYAAWIAACLVLMIPAVAPAAGRLSVEVTLDRSQAAVGQDVQATVVLRSDGLELPQFAFPTVAGLNTVRIADSQNFSWVNGRLSRSTTTVFRITPTAPGRYTIPSIRIAAGTERAESSPIALEVGAPGSASPPPDGGGAPGVPSPVWGDQSAPDLFVRLDVDRRRVFWNQPLIARYTFYTRVRLEQEALWEISEAPGFWREILGEPRHQRVRVGAHEYLTTQVVMAYFPTRTGRLTIGPGKVEARVLKRVDAPDSWSILGMPAVRAETIPLTTDRATIDVRPLPAGAPPGFHGAVGRLSLDVRVDRKRAHVGEPVTVTTLIRGEGNLAAAGDPEVRATVPLRTYEVGGGTTTDRMGDHLRGERRREVAFVPEVPGSFAIEPVRLAWFDPVEERYRTQVSDSIRVQIVPGDSTDHASGFVAFGPPASLRSRKGSVGSLTPEPSVGAISLAVGSGVVFLAASLWAAAREGSSRDPRQRRRTALKRIVLAARQARAGHDASAASRIAALVPEALGIRYDVDIDGRSLEDAIALARARGATPEVAEEARRLLAALEQLAYAPASAIQATSGKDAKRESAASDHVLASAERFLDRLAREVA